MPTSKSKIFLMLIVVVIFTTTGKVFAQSSANISSPHLVSISSTANPISLPVGGGIVTFIYKVSNLSTGALSNVSVTDNGCSAMSGELGDINDNHILDTNEIWIYNCTTSLVQTTTNIATATAYASGSKVVDQHTTTVNVTGTNANETLSPNLPNEGPNPNIPGLPDNGINPNMLNLKVITWIVLAGILVVLILVLFFIRKKK